MNDFQQLNSQYINGEWRDGTSKTIMENRNPYNHELIATYYAASIQDLDEAYEAASAVQKIWQNENPVTQRDVFDNAFQYIEENKEAIIDIIINEIGGTRLKAEFEIGLVKNMEIGRASCRERVKIWVDEGTE